MELKNWKALIVLALLLDNFVMSLHGSSSVTEDTSALRFHEPVNRFVGEGQEAVKDVLRRKRKNKGLNKPILCWYRVKHDASEVCYHSMCLDVFVTKTIKECISV